MFDCLRTVSGIWRLDFLAFVFCIPFAILSAMILSLVRYWSTCYARRKEVLSLDAMSANKLASSEFLFLVQTSISYTTVNCCSSSCKKIEHVCRTQQVQHLEPWNSSLMPLCQLPWPEEPNCLSICLLMASTPDRPHVHVRRCMNVWSTIRSFGLWEGGSHSFHCSWAEKHHDWGTAHELVKRLLVAQTEKK